MRSMQGNSQNTLSFWYCTEMPHWCGPGPVLFPVIITIRFLYFTCAACWPPRHGEAEPVRLPVSCQHTDRFSHKHTSEQCFSTSFCHFSLEETFEAISYFLPPPLPPNETQRLQIMLSVFSFTLALWRAANCGKFSGPWEACHCHPSLEFMALKFQLILFSVPGRN